MQGVWQWYSLSPCEWTSVGGSFPTRAILKGPENRKRVKYICELNINTGCKCEWKMAHSITV